MHHCRIAWSRNGLLAYITDENKVFVTWLQCKDGQSWDYVPPIQLPVPNKPAPICISWSNTNYNLAVIDSLGRVHIVDLDTASSPMNLITASAVRDQRQRPIELDVLAGSHWLDVDKNFLVPHNLPEGVNESNISASKFWNSLNPRGPFHPLKAKGGFVSINGNGMFRFLVQGSDQKYREVDTLVPDLKNVVHACFLQYTNNTLLMFTISDNFRLSVSEVKLNFTSTDIENVKINVNRVYEFDLGERRPLKLNAHFVDKHEVQIIIVYSDCLRKLCLKSSLDSLNNSFLELFIMSQPVMPEPKVNWELEEVDNSNLIFNEDKIREFIPLRYFIVLVHESGSITTLPLYPGASKIQVDKFGLGFDIEKLRNSKDIAFAPTGFCAVAYPLPTELELQQELENNGGELVLNKGPPELIKAEFIKGEDVQSAAKCLAIAYACTVINTEQCDDILNVCLTTLRSLDPEKAHLFFDKLVTESQRLLNVNLLAPEDQRMVERLVIVPSPPQRWLSFLVTLGTNLHWQKTDGAKAAYILLHLQLLAFGLTWTLKKISQRSKTNDVKILRKEISSSVFHINSMMGPMRWATDLIARITQEVYDMQLEKERHQLDPERPNVYMAILMSSVTRYLIRYFLRGVRTLSNSAKALTDLENKLNNNVIDMARRSVENSNLDMSPEQLRQALTDAETKVKTKLNNAKGYIATQMVKKIVVQLQKSPVNLDSFEKLILSINDQYKTLVSSIPDADKKKMDSQIILYAKVPDFYTPIVTHVLDSSKEMLFANTDVPNLYFYDTSYLEIDHGNQSFLFDGLRKRIMLSDEKINVCTRCAMRSQAIEPNKQAIQWMLLFQRNCICGGFWIQQKSLTKK